MNVRNGNELPMNTLFFDNTVGTVTDDERRRVLKRGTYTDSGLNGEQQVTIGPHAWSSTHFWRRTTIHTIRSHPWLHWSYAK